MQKYSFLVYLRLMQARKQNFQLLFLLFFISLSYIGRANNYQKKSIGFIESSSLDSTFTLAASNFKGYVKDLYLDLNDTSLNFQAFEQSLIGYHNLTKLEKIKRKELITLIDFEKPSNEDRFYIIDLCKRQILHKSIVAHGVNSGGLEARYFSNENNSLKSSLGFFVTSSTYKGKYDLALRLNGLEHSNNRASSRGVVIHAAKYATYDFLEKNNGVLGRSYGCPALPFTNFQQVVEWIKEGTCLYIYYPSKSYLKYSKFLNSTNYLIDFV
jgi:hypothetical protein